MNTLPCTRPRSLTARCETPDDPEGPEVTLVTSGDDLHRRSELGPSMCVNRTSK